MKNFERLFRNKKVLIVIAVVVLVVSLFSGTKTAPVLPEQQARVEGVQTLANQVKIVKIVDGDTVELEDGKRLRLIGIDTPESGDCYFKEATNRTKELLEGKYVILEKDISETDRYGRLLRYIWIGETLVNEQLVRDGFASSYSYPPDIKHQDRIVAAQKEAMNSNKGLWSLCKLPMDTNTTQPASIPTVKAVVKTNIIQPSSGGSCKYSCTSPDRDCSDFSTHTEAQTFFNCCGFTTSYDPMRLDKATGKGNGLACEGLR